MDFYNRLNYSFGNEDWHTEEQALQVARNDRVVCVTASGDRALHLLMTDCAEVVSVDMNAIQNYLLELKVAAIAHLDYEKYLAFLGCQPSPHRYTIFQELKPFLSPAAQAFWQQHHSMITRGVIYQGMVERFVIIIAKLIRPLNTKKIRSLFDATNLTEQHACLTHQWNAKLWRRILAFVLNTKLITYLIDDPGLSAYVDLSIKPGTYIYRRLLRYLNHHMAKKSILLQLFLLGKVLPEGYLPYVTLAGYQKIRQNVDRLTIKTTNIIDFLQQQAQKNQIDCFSLSDIASYMPPDAFNRLLHSMHHAAKPNARFCLREFMSKRQIPLELKTVFQRDRTLEKKLSHEESNFVYRFMVGKILKVG